MKNETKRVKEYKDKRIQEGKAYEFRVLINDEELTKFAKNISNKSEFLKNAIKEFMNKKHA
jgi:regulatory protein YycI of two-component signal transduction system YycFG